MENEYVLSVKEARKMARLSENAFLAGVHNGQIPHIRVGKRILIPRIAFESFLAGGK